MRSGSFEFEVRVNGKPITEYHKNSKFYVEGRKGSKYTLRFSNRTPERVKVVFSVDGLNVLTGDTVWEKGYVVDGYGTIEVPGWRINTNSVAEFVFSGKGDAYAESKGNVGVIGAMVFEKVPTYTGVRHIYHGPTTWYNDGATGGHFGVPCNTTYTNGLRGLTLNNMLIGSQSTMSAGSEASGVTRSASVNNLGTDWGKEQEFKTQQVYDNFRSYAAAQFQLFYDDAKGLQARGIEVSRKKPVDTQTAFPGYNDFGCKPPKRYRHG